MAYLSESPDCSFNRKHSRLNKTDPPTRKGGDNKSFVIDFEYNQNTVRN
jgi:hypothetical protein